jgi:hypothetical protein
MEISEFYRVPDLDVHEKINEIIYAIQLKLRRRPALHRMVVRVPCSMRLAFKIFPMLEVFENKRCVDGEEARCTLLPPKGGDMSAQIQEILKQPNDAFLRRFYGSSEIKYEDNTTGRAHDCTAIVLDLKKKPIKVAWSNKCIRQTLPDNQEIQVDQGMLRFSFYAVTASEHDTTEDCAPGRFDGSSFEDCTESMLAKISELKRDLAHEQAENKRLGGRCKMLMKQVLACGRAPVGNPAKMRKRKPKRHSEQRPSIRKRREKR